MGPRVSPDTGRNEKCVCGFCAYGKWSAPSWWSQFPHKSAVSVHQEFTSDNNRSVVSVNIDIGTTTYVT